MNIPNLDQIVLESLDFFQENPPHELDLSKFKLTFVVGSGNALNTGKLLFSKQAAIFADESNFKSIIESYREIIDKKLIIQAVIISASGEKDSVWETELANKYGLETTLLTCKPNSTAAKIADHVFAYKSISEPYTYNVSTYLGMILSATKEDLELIKTAISKLELPKNFGDYQSYAFILPDEYLNVAPMINIKRDELFGPHLSVRACAEGHARHAKFVHPWDRELVMSFGVENKHFGHPDHRLQIDLPDHASIGMIMALTYYVCGQIQAIKPPYFKQNIENFCNDYGPKAYGKDEVFEVIVPANK